MIQQLYFWFKPLPPPAMYNESRFIVWRQRSQIQNSASFLVPYMSFVTKQKRLWHLRLHGYVVKANK